MRYFYGMRYMKRLPQWCHTSPKYAKRDSNAQATIPCLSGTWECSHRPIVWTSNSLNYQTVQIINQRWKLASKAAFVVNAGA